MNEAEIKKLIKAAMHGREFSYSPYSNYCVGAALLTSDGRIFEGCNIENAAYGPSNCAERTAIFKAVSEGYRDFKAIAVVGGPKDGALNMAYPCGVCRQVMREFVRPGEFKIIVADGEDSYKEHTLEELLPESFGAKNL